MKNGRNILVVLLSLSVLISVAHNSTVTEAADENTILIRYP